MGPYRQSVTGRSRSRFTAAGARLPNWHDATDSRLKRPRCVQCLDGRNLPLRVLEAVVRHSAVFRRCATVRCSLLANHTVAISVPCAGHHPLLEASTAALAALYARFPGRLGGVAGAVGPHLRRRLYCVPGRRGRGSRLGLTGHHHLGRVRAGVDHVDQGAVFLGRDRQVPGVLDGDPIDGVLAPVRTVIGFPLLGSASALRAVGAGRYGDQVLRIRQVVGVAFPLDGVPSLRAADVGVAERHHVVDVELAGIRHDVVAVRCQPFAGRHSASPVGAKGWPGPALDDQHLLTCVLAIAVGVDPVVPVVTVVGG